MKKITIILTVLIAMTIKANAQIPNSGFENWTTVGGYEDPTGWASTNSFSTGSFYAVTKSTDHYPPTVGDYSVRIENNIALLPNESGMGMLKNAPFDNDMIPAFPITGHPTSLTGYYKFAPQNGDSLVIGIVLFNAGIHVSTGVFYSTASALNWTSFNIPINAYGAADSADIMIASWYPSGTPHGNSVLYVDNLNFDNLIPFVAKEICLVTVDTTSTKNLIIWEKPVATDIDSFKIYREISSVYIHIASIPYSVPSIFTDITNGVNPSTTAYKYKITAVDTYGNESEFSSYHRTIHVAISPASPCGYNLIWNDYIGFPITQYLIYRDSSNTGWVKKDSVSFGNTSWTDFTCYPANDTIAYLVEAFNPAGCNPSKTGGHNSSRSNVQSNYSTINSITSQPSDNDLNLKISPNPTNGKFTIQMTDVKLLTVNNCQLSIINVQGEVIFKSEITNHKSEIDLSSQPSGIYIVSIKSGEKVYHQKLIKE